MSLQTRLASVHDRFVAGFATWLTPGRVRIYPSALVLGAAAFFAIGEGVLLSQGYRLVNHLGVDFLCFYSAGRFVLNGRMNALYDVAAVRADQATVHVLTDPRRVGAFMNPPFAAPLFAPLALVRYDTALLIWWGVGLLALVLAVLIFHRAMLPIGPPNAWHLLLGSAVYYPTLAWLVYGQTTALGLLLYVGTFVLLRARRDFAAGCALGLLLLKPQLVLGYVLILVLKRRWRALAGFFLVGITWLAVGFVLSPTAMFAYLPFARVMFAMQVPFMWVEHSLMFFALLLLNNSWPAGAQVLGATLILAVLRLVAQWWRPMSWEPASRAWDLTMAASLTLGLLASPHLMLYDLMLLLLPLGIVWSRERRGAWARALDGGPLLAWTACLWLASFFGSYLTLLQLKLTAVVGWPPLALQIGVPVIVIWADKVHRQGLVGIETDSVMVPGKLLATVPESA